MAAKPRPYMYSAVTDSLNLMHGIIIRKTFFRLISTKYWNS